GYQYYPQLMSDGAGGAVIVWQDNRSGVDYDIYAQHIGPDGTLLWATDGLPVCYATGNQYNPQISGDGLGGCVMTWQDKRTGEYDTYAQRIDAGGSFVWQPNGTRVSGAVNDQTDPKVVADNSGGAIIEWLDYRAANGYPDIFCQRLL